MQGMQLGKVLVPQSKHYSWSKAVDVLGIGQDNLVHIPVQDNYRMDIRHLQTTIDRLIRDRTPILAVVAVVGTTEEGAVDAVHEIVQLREAYARQGVSFYLHLDAAYGGYTRAIFLDAEGQWLPWESLKQILHDQGILHEEIDWPPRAVYEAYRAMPAADSVTIDPHKMGYVPYAAGSVVFKDRRMRELMAYSAAYAFDTRADNPMLLGNYILEGSKAGAAAAAVWMAHRVVPLNLTGYGRLIGRSIEGAWRFYHSLLATRAMQVGGRTFQVAPLTEPDFNIVVFAFNEAGNTSLEVMDALNQAIYAHCSYTSGPVYAEDFLTSKTTLRYEDYGTAPQTLVAKLGIPAGEWERVRQVYVLRACVMTPYLTSSATYAEYWGNFLRTMQRILSALSAAQHK
jgi:glutamate/tyrosine decarboxylase-like PLP-dependent enzyme